MLTMKPSLPLVVQGSTNLSPLPNGSFTIRHNDLPKRAVMADDGSSSAVEMALEHNT